MNPVSVYPPLEIGRRRQSELPFPLDRPGFVFTHLGRGAVWLVLRALAPKSVAMPTYHCGSEVEAARDLGIEVRFYRVTPDLQIDLDDLGKAADLSDLVYLISYFGFPIPPESFEMGRTVVDAAHAFCSNYPDGVPIGADVDAAIFCFRKSLGVPDGGGLYWNGDPGAISPEIGHPSGIVESIAALSLGRAASSGVPGTARLLKRISKSELAAEAGSLTETIIGDWEMSRGAFESAAKRASVVTRFVARRCDPEQMRRIRRRNYEIISGEVGEWIPEKYRVLPRGTCPLYVPVMALDRTDALRRLYREGIRGVEIWPVAHPLLREDVKSKDELADRRNRLLALPVHQLISADSAVEIGATARRILASQIR